MARQLNILLNVRYKPLLSIYVLNIVNIKIINVPNYRVDFDLIG